MSQNVTEMFSTMSEGHNPSKFSSLGITAKILDILKELEFHTPTPIQAKAIPIAIEGKDILGVAQTGTGKTLSFAIPLIQSLISHNGAGLVLAPTRELALQINEVFKDLTVPLKIKTACIVGGASMLRQTQDLRRSPQVIIATPGRLMDHIRRKNFRSDRITMLILDEADLMLDMGFAPQINEILSTLSKERQTMLFSATIPKAVMNLAKSYMKLPISVEIAQSGTTVEKVSQELFIVSRESKIPLLEKILTDKDGSILVFSRTRHNASKLRKAIYSMGYDAAEIHSDRSLAQRREALDGFKSGKYKILVATDIAARGIDVSGISLVINFDLPEDPESYVHRIGRTARAGKTGHAISFATPDQRGDVRNIEKLIRLILPVSKHPDIEHFEFKNNDASTVKSRSFQRRSRPNRRR